MQLHADLSQPVAVAVDQLPWSPSPSPGVERRMLDRDGAEVARATSVVRYAPGSRFPTHVHGGGEEFIVLEGIFADEHGAYPAGSYVRNPPGSTHAPFTEGGCTILVKLRQMPVGDDRVVRGPEATDLHHDPERGVRVVRAAWDGAVELGEESHEVFLLAGTLTVWDQTFTGAAWIRIPRGTGATLHTRDAVVWHKSGHLPPSL